MIRQPILQPATTSRMERGSPAHTLGLIALLTLACASPVDAGELRVPLREGESLLLQVPEGWPSQIRQPRPDLPPTIALSSPQPSGFKVLITPFWTFPGTAAPSPAVLRGQVEAAARQAATQSVEGELPLREFKAPDRAGYYFSATDRAPRPGGYTHLTQGTIAYADLRLSFTILSNERPEAVVDQAMSMLRSLRQVRNGAAAGEAVSRTPSQQASPADRRL